MITKISGKESVNFAKQKENNRSSASNISNRKNRLQNEPVQDQLVKRNNVTNPKPSNQQVNPNNWGLIAGLGGIGVASVAIALASKKTKGAASIKAGATEAVDTLKKQAQEMTEVIEHLTKAPESRDFTDYLKYPQTDSVKAELNQYVEKSIENGIVTKHQLHVDKAPENFKAGMMAIKTKSFEDLAITRSNGNKVNMAKYIQELAEKKIYATEIKPIGAPRNGSSHVLWLPTAEDLKITKNGGLADVPPQLSEAMVKYNVASPVIISPLYKEDINSVRRLADGSVLYTSRGLSSEPLEKLVEFNMDVYDGNKFDKKQIKIEVFQHEETIDGKKLKRILLSTDSAFDSCYKYNEPLEEKERFGAIFSKAVYEFRKLVENYDGKSVKDVQNHIKDDKNNAKLKSKLKELQPDATILNDWQAASLAALYRIQAPLEVAAKKLDIKTAESMMDQPLSIIMHNGMYKGDTSGLKTAQIINTLFGENAAGVVANAQIKYSGDVKGPENVFIMKGIDNDGAETGSKYNNLINSAIAYADVVIPVSSNYAKEIVSAPSAKALAEKGEHLVLDRAAKSTIDIKTILSERFKNNNLFGVINGFDSSATRLSNDSKDIVKAKTKVAKRLEWENLSKTEKEAFLTKEDLLVKFSGNTIDKSEFHQEHSDQELRDSMSRYLESKKYKMNSADGFVYDENDNKILLNPEPPKFSKDEKLLYDYEYYDYSENADINQNIAIGDKNKKAFITWFKDKLSTSDDDKFTLHGKPEHTNIDDITVDNIKDIPIVLMGARVSDQKGFGEAKKAIVNLLKDYDVKYPGKQKPLVIIGGAAEDKSEDFLKELKKELGDKGNRVVAINGNVPNSQLFPITDINLGPSLFEPCGLTQQQAKANFALTVYSKVGGHVDTIKEGTGIVVPIEEYATTALPKAFDLYHNNKAEFNKMLDVASREDFNWISTDKASGLLIGPAIEHAQLLGLHSDKWRPLNRVNPEIK